MARAILTDVAVRRLRPPERGRREVWDAALPGFAVRITENGKRSFVLMTRLRGRPLRLTLGAWPATSLADARDRARDAIQKCARGEDPRVEKRAVAGNAPDTVEKVAAAFVAQWCQPRNRSWEEQERLLTQHVVPHWTGRRLAEIARADVVALTDMIAQTTPIQANRTLAVLKKMFRWALDRDLIQAHPAVGLTPPAPERQRDRVLTDAELRKLWPAFVAMAYPWGIALRVVLLTAVRRGEAEEMAWSELDLASGLWTIPAERNKVNVALVVPVPSLGIEALAGVPRMDGCPYVFSTRGNRPIRDWSGAVETATELSGVTDWSAHDLRRTVRTNLSRLGVASDIAERVLGHVIPGVRRVYDRYEYLAEKRDALERWAAHLTALVARDDG
jgi:integrase